MLPIFLQELPNDFNLILYVKGNNYEKVKSRPHPERKDRSIFIVAT